MKKYRILQNEYGYYKLQCRYCFLIWLDITYPMKDKYYVQQKMQDYIYEDKQWNNEWKVIE